MQFLTDFADQQVALPLSLVVAVALAWSGWWRGALAWSGVVAGTLACLAVLKVMFLACGWRWTNGELNSPSGHTATAALCYGGLALLLLPPRGAARHARLAIPPLLAALIGTSRLALHAHTVPEVVLGGMVGTAGAMLLPWVAGPPPQVRRLVRILPPVVLMLVLLHGGRLQAEGMLRHFSIDGLWPPESCQMPDANAWRRHPTPVQPT